MAAAPVPEEPRGGETRGGETRAARSIGAAGSGRPTGRPQGTPVFQREVISETAVCVRFDPATGEVTEESEELELSTTRLSGLPPPVVPLSESPVERPGR